MPILTYRFDESIDELIELVLLCDVSRFTNDDADDGALLLFFDNDDRRVVLLFVDDLRRLLLIVSSTVVVVAYVYDEDGVVVLYAVVFLFDDVESGADARLIGDFCRRNAEREYDDYNNPIIPGSYFDAVVPIFNRPLASSISARTAAADRC